MIAPDFTLAPQAATYQAGIPTQSYRAAKYSVENVSYILKNIITATYIVNTIFKKTLCLKFKETN